MAPKTTPLYAEHLRLGAKMIEFGSWLMPVQYSGIVDEHLAVRGNAGLFDISHMGQFIVSGPGAAAWLNRLLTNDIARLAPGHGHYTFLLNENGGVIDDLIVYRLRDEEFLLIVNAAKVDEDFAWMQGRLGADGVELTNRSAQYAGLALQGPKAPRLFDEFFGISRPGRNEVRQVTRDGVPFVIACTGYTGEEGYEFFFPATEAAAQWNRILEHGAPCRHQALRPGRPRYPAPRDVLPAQRLRSLPRPYPLEAGLSIFVDLNKPEFVGREALLAQREARHPLPSGADQDDGKRPPAPGALPRTQGWPAGRGALQRHALALARLRDRHGLPPREPARIGEELEIEIRGRRFPGTVERKPFNKPAQ